MQIPEDFLNKVEFLPDGTATDDQQTWLKAWGEFANKQMLMGKIKVWDIPEFNPETGEVPIAFIRDVYLKKRTAH